MAVKLSDCLPKKKQKLGIYSPFVGELNLADFLSVSKLKLVDRSQRETGSMVISKADNRLESSTSNESRRS
jgi:hypothetical protein